MALPPAVFNNKRTIAVAVSIQMMTVLCLTLTVRHYHHQSAPIEELTQASVVSEGMSMPPLPAPNLPLQQEGQKSEDSLRKNLGKLGEDEKPSPANQGLEDLKTRIAAKDPVPLMPPSPRMPPAPDNRASGTEKVGIKHIDSHVAKAEKVIAQELHPWVKAAPQTADHTLDTAAVKTGTPTTVTTVPHTNQDPTCCSKYYSKGGPIFIVRKDKCDLAKACHARCQHAGHECYCCKQ